MEYKDMPVDKLLWNTRMYPGCVSASESAAELGRRLADAQAQIEALRAQVKELEQWVQDQSTANLETMRHMDEMQSRAMDAEYQLTQRTAELEAVSNFIGVKYDAESKTWVSGQAPYLSAGTTKQEACIAAVDALRLACATWETKYRDLQAELERVRADNKALDEWRADVTVSLQRPGGAFFVDVPQHIKDLVKERDDLRTLIAALPKVEGAVVVSNGYVKDSTRCHALFGADEDAALYAALLQHRQGME
jgi:DNA repair exonuclease SbcCD ATPase subunit